MDMLWNPIHRHVVSWDKERLRFLGFGGVKVGNIYENSELLKEGK